MKGRTEGMSQSRYKKTKSFSYDEGEIQPFSGLRARDMSPATGVVEHILKSWERLDQLAEHYYNDPRKWYRILDANPELMYGGDLFGEGFIGKIIIIPGAEETAE